MLRLLRQRNFALLWFGGLISLAGDWMLQIALPIYVYELTGSALATSAMFIAWLLATLLLGSLAGVFVDRWDRRRTMIVTNLLLALTVLPLLGVRSEGWLWVVYVLAFVQSALAGFFSPAENALLPRLVGEEDLLAANSLNSLNNNLARLFGPPLGGLTAGYLGLTGVVLLDAASFLIAAGLISLVTVSGKVERLPVADAAMVRPLQLTARSLTRVWSEWLEGLRLIRSSRLLSVLFVITAIMSLGEGVFGVMFVIWVKEILHGGAPEIGWLMGGQAVGGLIGGVLMSYVGRFLAPARLLGVCGVAFGLLDLALFNYPTFVSGFWLGIVIIILVGIPGVGGMASMNTLLQGAVADEYRGRVFGALGTTAALLGVCGLLFAGTLGTTIGVIATVNIQGFMYVLAGAIGMAFVPSIVRARPTRPSSLAMSQPRSGIYAKSST